jgi:hypothetical protein
MIIKNFVLTRYLLQYVIPERKRSTSYVVRSNDPLQTYESVHVEKSELSID